MGGMCVCVYRPESHSSNEDEENPKSRQSQCKNRGGRRDGLFLVLAVMLLLLRKRNLNRDSSTPTCWTALEMSEPGYAVEARAKKRGSRRCSAVQCKATQIFDTAWAV